MEPILPPAAGSARPPVPADRELGLSGVWPTSDHRRTREPELLALLAEGDLLAFAEAWRRTSPAAHAVARRALGPGEDVETVLRLVYSDLLITGGITGGLAGGIEHLGDARSLESWVRRRAFTQAAEFLRAEGRPCPSPSLRPYLGDVRSGPPNDGSGVADPVERILRDLPSPLTRALTLAHDLGQPATTQTDPDAAVALFQALAALAREDRDPVAGDPLETDDTHSVIAGIPLADVILGLAAVKDVETVERALLDDADQAKAARMLRRGRRRLEGLPPAPDLGPRILLGIVALNRASVTAPVNPSTPRSDGDVVVTVGRAGVSPGVSPGASPGPTAFEIDTGPIPVTAPSALSTSTTFFDAEAEERFATPPSAVPHTVPAFLDGQDLDGQGADTASDDVVVRTRRGLGLLLIGTALGMLLGTIAVALR